MTSTLYNWTIWEEYWKLLPYAVFYNILQFVDSIDIRTHFKILPRKLILPNDYKTFFNNHFSLKKEGFMAKYNSITHTLHVISHYFSDNEDLSDIIFSHKSYSNVRFDSIRNNSTYFININNTHTETDNKYLYFSKISMFIQKGIKTNVVISYGPVQNVL
jgi:hypothetical protein